jgi:hypothetical protein
LFQRQNLILVVHLGKYLEINYSYWNSYEKELDNLRKDIKYNVRMD